MHHEMDDRGWYMGRLNVNYFHIKSNTNHLGWWTMMQLHNISTWLIGEILNECSLKGSKTWKKLKLKKIYRKKMVRTNIKEKIEMMMTEPKGKATARTIFFETSFIQTHYRWTLHISLTTTFSHTQKRHLNLALQDERRKFTTLWNLRINNEYSVKNWIN